MRVELQSAYDKFLLTPDADRNFRKHNPKELNFRCQMKQSLSHAIISFLCGFIKVDCSPLPERMMEGALWCSLSVVSIASPSKQIRSRSIPHRFVDFFDKHDADHSKDRNSLPQFSQFSPAV